MLACNRIPRWFKSPKTCVATRRNQEYYFPSPVSDVTIMLQSASRGDSRAAEELLPLVYDELRKLAAARMFQAPAGQTLQPTALVHEAWMRLVDNGARTWENRAHFFNAAAESMRHILIDRARRKARLKHGGSLERLNLEEVEVAEALPDEQLIRMDEALEKLKAEDPAVAQVVVLKFFGGLTHEDIVAIMGTSDRTVRRQWNYAKAWLFQAMTTPG